MARLAHRVPAGAGPKRTVYAALSASFRRLPPTVGQPNARFYLSGGCSRAPSSGFNRAFEVDVSPRQVLDDAGHGEVDALLRCLAVPGAVGCVGLVDGLADHDHGGRRSRSRA
jgi:hypothetical protein